jgi:hypothetical protein
MSDFHAPGLRPPRPATRLAAACCMLALGATAARAESLRAQYALSLMGLPFGSASAIGVIEPQSYKLDISMRTTGLANLVNNTKGAASATGKLLAEGPAPATFAHSIANSTETRTVRMAMSGNTVQALEVNPAPWDAVLRLPVSDEQKRHIMDPLSALLMRVPAGEPLVGPSACNRNIPVFDGVTRFDVRLAYVETRSARTRGYEGPVTVCRAHYTPISGHRPDSASTKFMAENQDMSVWLAPLTNAHVVVPLRIDIRTSVGMMSIDAAEFQIGSR